MKKWKTLFAVVALIATAIVAYFATANIRRTITALTNEKEAGKTRLEEIVNCIEKQDKGRLRNLFSENAQAKDAEFDKHLNTILCCIQGDIRSWACSTAMSDAKMDGRKRELMVCSWCSITTDKDTYVVYLQDDIVNSIEPNSEGLSGVLVVSKSDSQNSLIQMGVITTLPLNWKDAIQDKGETGLNQ